MNITTLKNKIKSGEFVAISTSSERIPEGIHKINKVQNKSFNIIAEGTTFWFDFPKASINKNMVGNKIKPIVNPIPLLNFLAILVYKYVENKNCITKAMSKDIG